MKVSPMALPTLAQARQLASAISYIGDVERRGYAWLKSEFLPALRVLAASDIGRDRKAASLLQFVLGDVHFCNRAPRAAIRAYRRSIQQFENSAAWREIGVMYDELAMNKAAVRCLRRAVVVDPTDQLAKDDLEIIERSPSRQALYEPGDTLWKSRELIAAGRARQAIAVLGRRQSIAARQHRARAYGALDDAEGVLHEWRGIRSADGRFEIESADWFFLPDSVWSSHEFWRILWFVRGRVERWNGLRHDSLGLWGLPRRTELILRYWLARTTSDVTVARKLSRAQPQWREARMLVRNLETGTEIAKPEHAPKPIGKNRLPIRGYYHW